MGPGDSRALIRQARPSRSPTRRRGEARPCRGRRAACFAISCHSRGRPPDTLRVVLPATGWVRSAAVESPGCRQRGIPDHAHIINILAHHGPEANHPDPRRDRNADCPRERDLAAEHPPTVDREWIVRGLRTAERLRRSDPRGHRPGVRARTGRTSFASGADSGRPGDGPPRRVAPVRPCPRRPAPRYRHPDPST